MKNIIGTLILICSISSIAFTQNTFQPKQINTDNVGVVYEKEFTIDIRLHTHGFLSIAANFARIKTFYKTRFYHFEIGELRHFKEERFNLDQPSNTGRNSRSFVFGKRNSLYVFRAGIGEKRYFSEKAKERGLSIGISYLAGVSLGLLKPYYLDIDYPTVPKIESEKYTEENADRFLNNDPATSRIFGYSGFSKGLSELSPLPGLHGKIGAHFDWGAFDEMVKAFEVGIMVDVFFKKVPLLVENEEVQNAENRPFFINLYLTLQLGKRW